MCFVFLFLLSCSFVFSSPALAAESSLTFMNDVRAIDGDSLVLGNLEVRLLCLDAVELEQTCKDAGKHEYPCGKRALKALEDAIGGQRVECSGDMADVYKRPLVRCHAGATDLAAAMVASGWAVATCERLAPLENEAREATRGIWRGKFQKPWNWRKKHPRVDEAKDIGDDGRAGDGTAKNDGDEG